MIMFMILPVWLSFLWSCNAESGEERRHLVRLYQSCGGREWYQKDGWVSSDPYCTWHGITCNDGGSVVAIELGSNNLVGSVPVDVYDFAELTALHLFSNPLRFSFEGIGSSNKLQDLRLDSTATFKLGGLENLQSLTALSLGFNGVRGEFPTEIRRLENLQTLDLSNNKLEGPLPDFLSELQELQTLRVDVNSLTGQLPSFNGLTHLTTLDIANNNLNGTIPNDFIAGVETSSSTSPEQVYINLSNNKITGGVPAELDRLDTLRLFLRENEITSLPESFCDNQNWNAGDVESFGCDGILCPPGTFNRYGRSRKGADCLPCFDDGDSKLFYGQVTCENTNAPTSDAADERAGTDRKSVV